MFGYLSYVTSNQSKVQIKTVNGKYRFSLPCQGLDGMVDSNQEQQKI